MLFELSQNPIKSAVIPLKLTRHIGYAAKWARELSRLCGPEKNPFLKLSALTGAIFVTPHQKDEKYFGKARLNIYD